MLIDLAQAGFADLSDADLCIIGAGAAGLTLAQEFQNQALRVVLLEAGGLSYSTDSQAAYRGHGAGQPMYPLEAMRLRYFGGTSNHWTGLCRPFDAIDFIEKPWVPGSGWPIAKTDLDPYIARTHQVLDLGPTEYALDKLAPASHRQLGLAADAFEHQVWRISAPTRFGPKYQSALEQSGNIRVLLNANVTELLLDASGERISRVVFKDPKLKTRALRVGRVVLATGGIENARLLLASRSVKAAGVGNEHDLVGRYFQDHPHVYTGTLKLFDESLARSCETCYSQFDAGSNAILPAVVMAWPAQRREQTLRNAFSLFPDRNLDASKSYLALRRLLGGNTSPGKGQGFWEDLQLVAGDLEGAATGAYNKLKSVISKTTDFRMFTRAEQAPNPLSRVMLNGDIDAYGLPRVTLDWQFTPLDKHSLRSANTLFGREIGRLGLGRVQLADWLAASDGRLGEEFHAGCHHMGTTRMAATPQKGVVDGNCKVFGTSNLYVAGSSVFVTGGYANPTFTIVQMALRLADHLKARG